MTVLHTFSYLDGSGPKTKTMNLTARKAIRYHCLGCSAGSKQEVRNCSNLDCVLHPYRMGANRKPESHPDSKSAAKKRAIAQHKGQTKLG